MAGFSGWFDGTYSRKQLRQIFGTMWGGKPSARPLGCTSGITSVPTLTVTSTTWTVGSFTAALDLETDATMGVSEAVFDSAASAITGSITAASSSFDRYDLLYVTMADAGPTPPTVLYVAGTVATTLPATPANSMPLAKITVPQSGTGSPTITLIAPRAYTAGGTASFSGANGFPSNPYIGQLADHELYGTRRWNGSVWGPLAMRWQANQVSGTTSLANGIYTTVPMDTFSVNTTGVAIGGGSFRAPIDGIYRVSGSINIASNSNGVRGGQFALNGSSIDGSFIELPNNGAFSVRFTMPTILVQCAANDVISMLGYQNSGGPLSTANGPGSRLTVELT